MKTLSTALLLLLVAAPHSASARDGDLDAFEAAFLADCQVRGSETLCTCLLETLLTEQHISDILERGVDATLYAKAHNTCAVRPEPAAAEPTTPPETVEPVVEAEVIEEPPAPDPAADFHSVAEPLRAALLAGSASEAWVAAGAPLRVLEQDAAGAEVLMTTVEAGGALPEAVSARLEALTPELNAAPERWSEDADGLRVRIEGTAEQPGVELRFLTPDVEGASLKLDALVLLPASAAPEAATTESEP